VSSWPKAATNCDLLGPVQSDRIAVDADAGLPLSGLRILDFTDRTGVYCGKLLADIGADVIKVELPMGDSLRRKPPFIAGAPSREASLLFAYYNDNKRGVTLDWTRAEALPILARLSARVDVILISPDGRRPIVGMRGERPDLPWLSRETLVCSITPFGLSGPWRKWRATPFTSFAASGQMFAVGPVDGPPVAMPGQQLYDQASTRAAIAVEAALCGPNAQRQQTIDISAHNVGAWQQMLLHQYALAGRIQNRATNFGPPPGGSWKCRDGVVDIAAHGPHHWDLFVEMLGRPGELSDELYRDRGMRVQLFDMLNAMIEVHMREQSAPEFVERGQAMGLPCALLYRPEDFVKDVQPHARETFVDVDHPLLGTLTMPGPSMRSATPLVRHRRAAPTLGESNQEVYIGELGYVAADLEGWSDDGLV
jgi:crotonobetainyl-CoA:carnitine CoA-transferase CaiB-like acyl-CoA transferase